jgi:addiction module RelB/DinJ family antitoxin
LTRHRCDDSAVTTSIYSAQTAKRKVWQFQKNLVAFAGFSRAKFIYVFMLQEKLESNHSQSEVRFLATAETNANVMIDADIKEADTRLLERMGLDPKTAIELFYRQIIAERRLPFQSAADLTLDEKIVAAALKRNPKRVTLQTDENGNVVIDKEKHLDLCDWAVNG